jgi:hypothetical protein
MTSQQQEGSKEQQECDTASCEDDDDRGDELLNKQLFSSNDIPHHLGEEVDTAILQAEVIPKEEEEEEEEKNEEKSVIVTWQEEEAKRTPTTTSNDETAESSSEQSSSTPSSPVVLVGGVLEPAIRDEINKGEEGSIHKCKTVEHRDESRTLPVSKTGKSPSLMEDEDGTCKELLPPPGLVRQNDVQQTPVIGAVAVPGPLNIVTRRGGDMSDDSFIASAALSASNATTVMATAISSAEFEMQVRERIIREAAEATLVVVDDDNKEKGNRRTTPATPAHDEEETRIRKQKCRIIACGTILAIVLLLGAAAIGVVVGMREEEQQLDETP